MSDPTPPLPQAERSPDPWAPILDQILNCYGPRMAARVDAARAFDAAELQQVRADREELIAALARLSHAPQEEMPGPIQTLIERYRRIAQEAQPVGLTSGSDRAVGKHDGCEYFVLDLTHDPHAQAAIRAYAESCRDEYPVLAADLNAKSEEPRP